MQPSPIDAFRTAQRLVGEINERPGPDKNHPAIVWFHELCRLPDSTDEVPWCSSFVNWVCWLHRMTRSKSAAARSWLLVGVPKPLDKAMLGDVVVLKRGAQQPGPDVIKAPGHVGFYAGFANGQVHLIGGNQSNSVTIARYPAESVLGVRRVA